MNPRSRSALVLRLALNNTNQYEIVDKPPSPQHSTGITPALSEHNSGSDGPGYIECLEAVLTPYEPKELDDNEAGNTAASEQNPETILSEDIPIMFSEADSIDSTSPRQTTDIVYTPPLVDQPDLTELTPVEFSTAEAKTCLSRYPIEESELVLSGNLSAKTETSTETNLLTNETESVPSRNSTVETETNDLTGETEFVRDNMAVAVHKESADDCLGLDFDSDDSVKDPNYVPDTVSSPPSLHNSPVRLTKKRKINPANREIAKKRRNQGLEYTSSTTKKVVKGKTMGPPCAETCKLKLDQARGKNYLIVIGTLEI